MPKIVASALISAVAASSVSTVPLATFDSLEESLTHTWRQQNDPVMGGASSGTFSIVEGVGVMEGTVANIPSLGVPGFIKVSTSDSKPWPDVSSCTGLVLNVKSTSTPSSYGGYRVAFGSDKSGCGKFFARGFKADFSAPEDDFGDVQVPFDQFTKCWDDGSGDAIQTCQDKPEFCPTQERLQKLQTVSIWAEGKAADVKIEVQSVSAYGCSAEALTSATPGSLVTFDGAEETSFKFKILNDPVMGGKSTGSWSLGSGFGILDGEVVDVPSLSAPGFIKAAGDGTFPDVSAFASGNLVLSVRSSTPEYAGYRVTLVSGAVSVDFACAGGGGLPFSRGCYKEKFSVPAGSDFVDVKIPFNTFSDKWSSATGEHTAECADDASTCLTAAKLSKIRRVEFWGEGAKGKLHLEIQSVSAEDANGQRMVLA